ncbi:LAETG motif-containing sortase-dependent surface protein [Streptomyces sp. AK02-01A]|uniref:LAETG motif-containing sortase-dependent surface protein n=1 Tax=Streptomyces sp. AK02-01A TaxID=3028648 RepID=UPI0029BDF6B5|nr:LAETG motif-containing sortase-dependent surface protein [Streptomyces sp. AK02-01A]MDX3849269.1 LAETG motif-containing sortase-dependent surface protein [Streptomyces sp. AK02-01A]
MFSSISASSVRRRGISRLAAAVLVPGLVAMGSLGVTGAAAADEAPQHQGGAAATLDGLKTYDGAVLHANGKDQQLAAGLFEMTVDGGGKLKTYCIDIHNPTQEQAKYLETPWDQTSLGANKNAGRIRWILEHSYPQIDDLSALASAAGTGPLTEKTAAAGTQVAIWRYSDNADVDASDAQAEKLAAWLEKSAKDTSEPKASLTLEPGAVSGKAGEKLGPVTVRTDADSVTVTPPADSAASGVKITDKDGKPVTAAVNGTELYFDVPSGASDGVASLGVQATTSVPVGRAFAGVTKSQTQILAGSSDSTVSATATANWAKRGPIPALTAEKNCAKGGVDITASNKGDEEFTFELAGTEHSIAPGGSETITVPVGEDAAYDFTITGPGGFSQNFKGVLDCKTAGSTTPATEQPSSAPSPASAGGSSAGSTGDLAETGSSSATPIIAGIAIALVVLGGAAVFFLRRKNTASGE